MGRFYNLIHGVRDEGETDTPARETYIPAQPDIPFACTPKGYGALMSVNYASCEQTKARSMISLPASVILKSKSKRERLENHPLTKLLNGMVNEEMSISSLMAWTVLRRDTFGNAYWWLEWYKDKVVGIWPVTSHVQQDFIRDAPRGYRTRYTVYAGDKYVPAGTYFSDEIINIPTAITKNGIKGESLAKLAAEDIGLSINLERFYKSMLDNGNFHLGHVEVPDKRITQEEKDSLSRAIAAKRGVDEAGKTPIFGYGAKWVSDRQTMKDASLIEQQRWVLHQVCRECNVPPWKVYDTEGATYSGGQQARIDYVTDTIVPDVRTIELALAPALRSLPHAEIKFSVQGLMRGDDASRSQYYREMAYSGSYTRADIRAFEDLPPINGLDKPLFPLNYGTVNSDGSVNVFTATPKVPADGNQTGVSNVQNQ